MSMAQDSASCAPRWREEIEMIVLMASLEVAAEWSVATILMYVIAYFILRAASVKLTGILIAASSLVTSLIIVSLIDIAFRVFSDGPEVLVDAPPLAMHIPNVFSVPFAVSMVVIFTFSRWTPKSDVEEV
jgi:hypothetical protein